MDLISVETFIIKSFVKIYIAIKVTKTESLITEFSKKEFKN